MKYLLVRTDRTEAYVGICEGNKLLAKITWQAGRELSNTLNSKIDELIDGLGISYDDLKGIVFFSGPGSFTGLRIGASVVNALAYAQSIKIASTNGDNWIEKGAKLLDSDEGLDLSKVEYGRAPNITMPRK